MWRQCAAQTGSHSAYDIFSAPQSSDGLGRRISGKAPRHRGWIYSQTRPTGPNGQLPLHLGPTKTSAKDLPRSRSVRISVVRFEKSLVANLSAKRQLSVAKLSAKRIFSLAKRDFLVANGRMAADFSSPDRPLHGKFEWSSILFFQSMRMVLSIRLFEFGKQRDICKAALTLGKPC